MRLQVLAELLLQALRGRFRRGVIGKNRVQTQQRLARVKRAAFQAVRRAAGHGLDRQPALFPQRAFLPQHVEIPIRCLREHDVVLQNRWLGVLGLHVDRALDAELDLAIAGTQDAKPAGRRDLHAVLVAQHGQRDQRIPVRAQTQHIPVQAGGTVRMAQPIALGKCRTRQQNPQ